MPVPAEFKTLEEAKLYRRELNLRRGAYHPGYVIQEKEDPNQQKELLPDIVKALADMPDETVIDGEVVVRFEYQYDLHGNWTQRVRPCAIRNES